MVLRKFKYKKPFAIQCQAIPALLSGRDCIGIAETGSGKTLGFVLPLIRHILDQEPRADGDGPIGIVMAPTRELAAQIYKECKRFAMAVGLSVCCVYGGPPIAEQIAKLKSGADVIVCTPGRMIDLLCANRGRVTNLRRVTFVVLDEADRMFDLGFEPQIMRVLTSIRPDRQTAMFSATFPKKIEVLARRALKKPVQIIVGSRSAACLNVQQHVEVMEEDQKFKRLLQLLGVYVEKGSVLIFVRRQEDVNALFRDLIRYGYPCLSLHGGMEQIDRDSTIVDFKNAVANVLVATSVAARGLHVDGLELVVNYEPPDHYEDYVHRIGRTGRAGRQGVAYTFLAHTDEMIASDIVRALKQAHVDVPKDVLELAKKFHEQKKHIPKDRKSRGFLGTGYKFDKREEEEYKEKKRQERKALGVGEEEEEDGEEGDNENVKADADHVEGGAAGGGTGGDDEGKELSFMKSGGKDEDEEHRKTIKKVGGSGVIGSEPTPASSPSAPAGSVVSVNQLPFLLSHRLDMCVLFTF
jgi:ATP-dependent RNA helicase DDX46/PRP5